MRLLGLPRCYGCGRIIWWWQFPTHRRALKAMHWTCFEFAELVKRVEEQKRP